MASVGTYWLRRERNIVVDEGKAPFITKSFALYSTGKYSLHELRDKINSVDMTGRKGKPLSATQYQYILKNPLYYGVFRYNGEVYEGTHEPIITRAPIDFSDGRYLPSLSIKYSI